MIGIFNKPLLLHLVDVYIIYEDTGVKGQNGISLCTHLIFERGYQQVKLCVLEENIKENIGAN